MSSIDFDLVRARNPLPEYCQKRGIELRRNGAPGELVGLCPLHKEKTASFHVYPDNHYYCYGCAAHGDVTNLDQALQGGTRAEAAARLGAERRQNVEKVPATSKIKTPTERRPLELPRLSIPALSELYQLSENRGISVQALRIAAGRKFLWTYEDSREGRAWIVTDRARRLAIARRLDGQPWEYRYGEYVANPAERSKTKNLYGSQGNWPIGILESQPFPAIALVEGAPDFLSVFDHTFAAGAQNLVAAICLSGAAQQIPDSALSYFVKKRVRIFAHDDKSGYRAAARWKEQLAETAAVVDIFEFSGLHQADKRPVSDLNDLLKIDPVCRERFREILGALMDFAQGREGAVCR